MLAPIQHDDDDQYDESMTLSDLGVAGLFDDDALATSHDVSRAPLHTA